MLMYKEESEDTKNLESNVSNILADYQHLGNYNS